MTVSVLLRLVATPLSQDRVAGQAEVVESGETVVFKEQEEMLAFLHRTQMRDAPGEGDNDGSQRNDGSAERP